MSVLKERLSDLVAPVAEDERMAIDFSQRKVALSATSVKTAIAVMVAIIAGIAVGVVMGSEPSAQMPEPKDPIVQPAGASALSTEQTSPQAQSQSQQQAPPPEIVVSVVGLVVRPGVVTVPGTARVSDAIAAAGGMLPEADPASVLLAAPLVDGQQVVVGSLPLPPETQPEGIGAGAGTSGGVHGGAGGAGAGDGKININSATEAQLEELPGVGPATARKIIDFREKNGPFSSVDALEEVPGLGPAKVAALRDMATV